LITVDSSIELVKYSIEGGKTLGQKIDNAHSIAVYAYVYLVKIIIAIVFK